mmetsp:Transcript_19329/g.41070  ORF Transcript_19329/g.41070 Transcript_19329/m.41070 type:complete len:187 (+) Transcript_19329:67-627(+)
MSRTSRSPALAWFSLVLGAGLLCHSTVFVGLGRIGRFSSRSIAVSMSGKPKDGIFTPVVKGAKVIVGEGQLKEIRAKVIKAHGELMANFIGTHDWPSGEFALEKLFEAADADGNGRLDKEELKVALQKLGFSWVDDQKAETVAKKGDLDGDGLIDFEEFKKLAPTVLRQNLMKLAKENGGELGFLS